MWSFAYCDWDEKKQPSIENGKKIKLELYPDKAPITCENFEKLVREGFYDGLKESGEKEIMSLVRCAWAGSQKYGVLTWSGDIYSSFRAMREQLQAGLNMGMAGIPWWTSDIGGFVGGNIEDEDFRNFWSDGLHGAPSARYSVCTESVPPGTRGSRSLLTMCVSLPPVRTTRSGASARTTMKS